MTIETMIKRLVEKMYIVLSTDEEGDDFSDYLRKSDKGNHPSVKRLFIVYVDDYPGNNAVYQVLTTLDTSQLRAVKTVLEVAMIPA